MLFYISFYQYSAQYFFQASGLFSHLIIVETMDSDERRMHPVAQSVAKFLCSNMLPIRLINRFIDVLHRFEHYLSLTITTAYISMHFLGFTYIRLGIRSVLRKNTTTKNPMHLGRLEPGAPRLRVLHFTTEPCRTLASSSTTQSTKVKRFKCQF